MKISIIAGARPNFMKIAPIIQQVLLQKNSGKKIDYRLIHTGQHYDRKMSGDFFEQLGIPEPHVLLHAGGGSQAEQTAAVLVGVEKELIENPCDLLIVVGDVTSTMAATIAAKKIGIEVAHVEAGIRSDDWSMPEEINRVVTDRISNYYFTTSEQANQNLLYEGCDKENIFFVGNTMIDTLVSNLHRFQKPSCWDDHNLKKESYFVLTLHRPSNVDDQNKLFGIFNRILENTKDFPIVFPVHPRTRKNLEASSLSVDRLILLEPMSYLEFNYLVSNAKGVITDSGGITEETTYMKIPCITLRNTTERPETVTVGSNALVGDDNDKFCQLMNELVSGNWKKSDIPALWDGKTAVRIVDIILNKIQKSSS